MVIPTILQKSWEEVEKKLRIYKEFTRNVHVDFIDGKFTNNTTFLDPEPFFAYKDQFNLEAHLMVDEPIEYLDRLGNSGFMRFLGHVEKMSNQEEFVAKGETLGAVGLALDIETPLTAINVPYIDLDLILLMSIKAGDSGRPFDERVIEKIKKLKESFVEIEVDGGINDTNLPILKESGVQDFCVNSFIFQGDPKKQFEKLTSLAAD